MQTAQWIAWVSYAVLMLWCIRRFRQRHLLQDTLSLHLLAACSLGLILLWMIRGGLQVGLEFHMLGLTAVTLILGGYGALMAAALALLGLSLLGELPHQSLGAVGWFKTALPIGWTVLVQWSLWRWLPHHLFVFLFVGAFGCGALSQLWHMLAWGGWLGLTEQLSWLQIRSQYWLGIPMLIFPEGLINGMTITLLAVYKPQWLVIYDDREYVLKR